MLENVPPVSMGDIDPYAATSTARAGARGNAFALQSDPEIPASPPPEVLDALDHVQSVQEELDARGLTASFELDPGAGVRVRLLDSSGAVVKEFSPGEALEALSGEQPIGSLEP